MRKGSGYRRMWKRPERTRRTLRALSDRIGPEASNHRKAPGSMRNRNDAPRTAQIRVEPTLRQRRPSAPASRAAVSESSSRSRCSGDVT